MSLRSAFKLFVTIDNQMSNIDNFLQQHNGYPMDNVIQIKLNEEYFKSLFQGNFLSSSLENTNERYSSPQLLQRLEVFFSDERYHNYNHLASDITILINNTFDDVDINPISLENACKKNGLIFNYFFKSQTVYKKNTPSTSIEDIEYEDNQDLYDSSSGQTGNILVYQLIAREIDNMISRNIYSTSEDNTYSENYDDLDNLYTLYHYRFWDNIQEGDSIYIEGSFNVPTGQVTLNYKDQNNNNYSIVGSGNIPIILQFVNSTNDSYGFQIPPQINLNGEPVIQEFQAIYDSNSNLVRGLYQDSDLVTATDYTTEEISLTNDMTVNIIRDSTETLLDNISLNTDPNNNISVGNLIDSSIPVNDNHNSLYSQVGDYEIIYSITDIDGFSATKSKNVKIYYTKGVEIAEDYYESYSSFLNSQNFPNYYDINITNYQNSSIYVPFGTLYDHNIHQIRISALASSDVTFSDEYAPNAALTIFSTQNNNSIGSNTAITSQQFFSIQNTENPTYITANATQRTLNFITIRLQLPAISDQQYDLSTNPASNYVAPNMPTPTLINIDPSSFLSEEQVFHFNSVNYTTKENLESAIQTELQNNGASNSPFTITYTFSKNYGKNGSQITISDSQSFSLEII